MPVPLPTPSLGGNGGKHRCASLTLIQAGRHAPHHAFLLAALFSISPIAAHAEVGVGLSVEQFVWAEKSDSGVRLLRERGLRRVANLEWMNNGNPDFSYGYIGKWYMGRVDYAGRTQTGTSFATTTAYDGASHEFRLNFHSHIKQHRLDYVAGIGQDAWRRAIDNRPRPDPVERFELFYLRAGVSFPSRTGPGWNFSGGIKYPIQITEKVDGPSNALDSGIALHPGKKAGYYGEAGYRFRDSPWRLSLYYEGYRFARSRNAAARSGGRPVLVHQPESSADMVGIRAALFY